VRLQLVKQLLDWAINALKGQGAARSLDAIRSIPGKRPSHETTTANTPPRDGGNHGALPADLSVSCWGLIFTLLSAKDVPTSFTANLTGLLAAATAACHSAATLDDGANSGL
jgi:hypothetical protein